MDKLLGTRLIDWPDLYNEYETLLGHKSYDYDIIYDMISNVVDYLDRRRWGEHRDDDELNQARFTTLIEIHHWGDRRIFGLTS